MSAFTQRPSVEGLKAQDRSTGVRDDPLNAIIGISRGVALGSVIWVMILWLACC